MEEANWLAGPCAWSAIRRIGRRMGGTEPVMHPKGRPGRPGAPALRDRAAAGAWSSACSPVPATWPTTPEAKAST